VKVPKVEEKVEAHHEQIEDVEKEDVVDVSQDDLSGNAKDVSGYDY
jgi:hypothetical protein